MNVKNATAIIPECSFRMFIEPSSEVTPNFIFLRDHSQYLNEEQM